MTNESELQSIALNKVLEEASKAKLSVEVYEQETKKQSLTIADVTDKHMKAAEGMEQLIQTLLSSNQKISELSTKENAHALENSRLEAEKKELERHVQYLKESLDRTKIDAEKVNMQHTMEMEYMKSGSERSLVDMREALSHHKDLLSNHDSITRGMRNIPIY